MRNTVQRNEVLRVVQESCDHPCAEVIYTRTKNAIPNISLGTVYRNLWQLVDLGFVKHIKVNKGGDRFDKTTCVHSHFHCNKCGVVMDIDNDPMERLCEEIESLEHNIEGIELLLHGSCKNCLKNKE